MNDIKQNPDMVCPVDIISRQTAAKVQYYDFSGQKQTGIIEIDQSLVADIVGFFALAFSMHFPIEVVARSSDPRYAWNDDVLMAKNVSSGFNYRRRPDSDALSLHALGRAFDINPVQNPYIHYDSGQEIIEPLGSKLDPEVPGTLTLHHPLVAYMIERGWEWGGNWTADLQDMIDYQHFEKPLN